MVLFKNRFYKRLFIFEYKKSFISNSNLRNSAKARWKKTKNNLAERSHERSG